MSRLQQLESSAREAHSMSCGLPNSLDARPSVEGATSSGVRPEHATGQRRAGSRGARAPTPGRRRDRNHPRAAARIARMLGEEHARPRRRDHPRTTIAPSRGIRYAPREPASPRRAERFEQASLARRDRLEHARVALVGAVLVEARAAHATRSTDARRIEIALVAGAYLPPGARRRRRARRSRRGPAGRLHQPAQCTACCRNQDDVRMTERDAAPSKRTRCARGGALRRASMMPHAGLRDEQREFARVEVTPPQAPRQAQTGHARWSREHDFRALAEIRICAASSAAIARAAARADRRSERAEHRLDRPRRLVARPRRTP